MVTDEERREVAERLRELDYADLQESLICAYLDALGIEGYEDWIGIAHRLADLIDHDTTTDTTKSPGVTTKCDRDALLALADEMDERAPYGWYSGERDSLREYARRIREALGAQDA